MSNTKFSILWLRFAATIEPIFGSGIPWNCNAPAFERLEDLGLVERVPNGHTDLAIATTTGRTALERFRMRIRERQARMRDREARPELEVSHV